MSGPADTKDQFWEILQTSQDDLSLVIKAHHSIEAKVHRTLEELLPHARKVELHRVSFLLKVDFLIGLGVLPGETRPIYDLANQLRNRYAHNPYAEFTDGDSAKVKSAVLLLYREYPFTKIKLRMLAILFHVAFAYAGLCYENVIFRQLRREAWQELADDWVKSGEEALNDVLPTGCETAPEIAHDTAGSNLELRMREKVEKKLAERHPSVRLTPNP